MLAQGHRFNVFLHFLSRSKGCKGQPKRNKIPLKFFGKKTFQNVRVSLYKICETLVCVCVCVCVCRYSCVDVFVCECVRVFAFACV